MKPSTPTAKHTAGLWAVSIHPKADSVCVGPLVRNGGGHVIGIVEVYSSGDPDELEANAHLIAAAPDLLAACEAAVAALDENATFSPSDRLTLLDTLRLALTKAAGEKGKG